MKEFFKQLGSLLGAGVAAACCLGVPLVLSTLGAVGLGFIIHDAYLLPLFVGFVALSLWTLHRSASRRGLAPFWLALAGGVAASIGLWLLVTGTYPHSWPLYAGLSLLVSGSIWDVINGRSKTAACETSCAIVTPTTPDNTRRAVSGAAIAVAAAGAFYGLYKSVEAVKPAADAGVIACWGINSCKGTTACSTAFNACTSMNSCRGRGYLNVSATECKAKGGRPLAGSEADPAEG